MVVDLEAISIIIWNNQDDDNDDDDNDDDDNYFEGRL